MSSLTAQYIIRWEVGSNDVPNTEAFDDVESLMNRAVELACTYGDQFSYTIERVKSEKKEGKNG